MFHCYWNPSFRERPLHAAFHKLLPRALDRSDTYLQGSSNLSSRAPFRPSAHR